MSPRKKAEEPSTRTAATSSQARCSRKVSSTGRQVEKVNGHSPAGKLKIFWAVFNDSFEPVALFAFADYAKAVKKAAYLSATLQVPHFVQKVKRFVED